MIKLKSFWEYLHSTLWFLPFAIVGFSILLAIILIELEPSENGTQFFQKIQFFGSGAEAARIMLSTIAGSIMGVVGVTFSMTLVTLTLVSSQYTSRILRNFTRDRVTQSILGLFVGIFTYCLIVLCTISANDQGEFIPRLAVFFAFILALAGVGALIYFIHHIACSIQASNILSSIADETFASIDLTYLKDLKNEIHENDENIMKSLKGLNWFPILANKNGYIENVNLETLKIIAREKKTILRIDHVIGGFVVRDTVLVSLTIDREQDQETVDFINSSFIFNKQRTMEQDISFGIRQLVDIALKALSSGINDTTTAVMSLNYLTAIMVHLTSRKFNSCYHFDEKELRVITKDRNFEELLDESFDQIRESAKENTTIILKLIQSLQIIANKTLAEDILQAVDKQAYLISEMVKLTNHSSYNREAISTQLIYLNTIQKNQLSLLSLEEGINKGRLQ